MIEDWALFDAVLEALATQPRLRLIGISGGEPFVERKGLCRAVEKLTAANRQVVLYTSAIWANVPEIPKWISSVLAKTSSVFLSTDAFHATVVSREALRRAAELVLSQSCQLIVQVLNDRRSLDDAGALREELTRAWGDSRVELNVIPPLPYGRGRKTLAPPVRLSDAAAFGRCGALAAPVVRYDGRVIACCNEEVIMGRGPDSLKRRCSTAEEVRRGLSVFRSDPSLVLTRRIGVGALLQHPQLEPLQGRKCRSLCDACWLVQEELGNQPDPLLSLIAQGIDA